MLLHVDIVRPVHI